MNILSIKQKIINLIEKIFTTRIHFKKENPVYTPMTIVCEINDETKESLIRDPCETDYLDDMEYDLEGQYFITHKETFGGPCTEASY